MRYEEQRRQRINSSYLVPKYQFRYRFEDVDVIYDASHLLLTHLYHSFTANEIDKSRLETFLKTFIPTFFDIDRDTFQAAMSDIYETTPPNEEAEDEAANNDDNAGRGRRGGKGKNSNLLRGVLERGRQGQKEDSVLDSKETTPDVHSNDEDTPASTGTPTDQPIRVDEAEHRWLSHPRTGNETADLNVPFKREDFHLYASLNIYCFFRMFEMLYTRLLKLKASEKTVKEDVYRAELHKPAHDLKLIDRKPSDFFTDVGPCANYYRQTFTMCEEVVKGELDAIHLEETLRRFYMDSGWQLYGFDKMLAALLRFALNILVSDNKDKSLDIINHFYKDRKEDETTHQAELSYRKQVEKLTKEGDIYRIRYVSDFMLRLSFVVNYYLQNRPSRAATIQIFKKDDKTYQSDELAAQARWSYYISTYSMLDPTEGIPHTRTHFPLLRRNMPKPLTEDEDRTNAYGTPQWNEDRLVFRIAPHNYRIMWDPDTYEWWVHNAQFQKRGLGAYEELSKERKRKFEDAFGERGSLILKREGEKLDEEIEEFRRWVNGGPADARDRAVTRQRVGGLDGADDGDEVMGGT